jgi:hypothetical protein
MVPPVDGRIRRKYGDYWTSDNSAEKTNVYFTITGCY